MSRRDAEVRTRSLTTIFKPTKRSERCVAAARQVLPMPIAAAPTNPKPCPSALLTAQWWPSGTEQVIER